ncbi:MAG: hypothetical protein LWX56_13585 [Ignavibacteria bacterium]|nr:hypothetical protein [Ignavibacteria bacterium]
MNAVLLFAGCSEKKINFVGQFAYVFDYFGRQYVYFTATNFTGETLDIEVVAYNSYLNEEKTIHISKIGQLESFKFGYEQGWSWQPGEILIIRTKGGQRLFWKYGYGANVSFGSGSHCKGDNEEGMQNWCTCPGYKPFYNKDSKCDICGHPKSRHN